MKQYNKPTVEVVELLISDNIAAIAPRTIYRLNSAGANAGAITNETVAGDFFNTKSASLS